MPVTAAPQILEVEEYLQAASLRAAKVPYLGCSPNEKGRIVFSFADGDGKASDTLQKHLNGRLRVSSFDLAASVDLIKNELFAARRAGGLS